VSAIQDMTETVVVLCVRAFVHPASYTFLSALCVHALRAPTRSRNERKQLRTQQLSVAERTRTFDIQVFVLYKFACVP
jgi:hypothetical protein